MKEISTKIDEITVTLIPSVSDIKNLDMWQAECENISLEIEQNLQFKTVFAVNEENRFPSGYNIGKSYSDKYISVAYNSTYPKIGMIVKFSAQGLNSYLRNYHSKLSEDYQVPDILRELNEIAINHSMESRLTRLDATIDIIDYRNFTVDALYKKLSNGKLIIKDYRDYQSRSTINSINNDGETNTIYIGSKSAGTQLMLRIYNKRFELLNQKSPNDNDYKKAKDSSEWVRFEAVNKGKRAHKLGVQLLSVKNNQELSSYILQIITDKYRFFDVKKEQYILITKDMLDLITEKKDVVKSEKTFENDLEKQKSYFYSSTAGFQSLLFKIRTLYGENEMDNYIKELVDFQKNVYHPNESTSKYVSRKKREKEHYLEALAKKPKTDEKPPI